jgi:4-amino-4-deoxy-L-arabinose transferase-like glycosyltransferase
MIAFALALIHFIANANYGYFRDELNYIACGDHLSWGFVDHPPLVPALVKLTRVLFGDSLRTLRLVPATASGATVVLAALLTQEIGGSSFAMIIAALAALISPQYLSNGSIFTTNSLEPVFWTFCAWCAVRAIRREAPVYWLACGAALGLGFENKYSIAVFGLALGFGLLATAERRRLLSPWLWAGVGLALLIALPNLVWNQRHGWPFLELMANIRASGRDVVLGPFQFVVQQILLMHPFAFPIWLLGLASLFVVRAWRQFRFLGWAWLATFAFFLLSHGKNYYLTPAYILLFAPGSVVIAQKIRAPWVRASIVILLLAGGALLAPLTLPVLPPQQLAAYLDALPLTPPRTEVSHTARFPQHYADQFGWVELASLVGNTWQGLPAADKEDCPFFGQNYGQAGAVDFFGRKYGMPAALSGHQTYFLWGPQGHTGSCLLVADDRREVLEGLFEDVTLVGATNSPYALESRIPLFLCRRLRSGSLSDLWPRLKKWR